MKTFSYTFIIVLIGAIFIGAGLQPLAAQDESPPGPIVVRLYFQDRVHLDAVAGRLDIWEVHPEQGVAVAAVTPDQLRWLEGLGYRVEVDAALTERAALLQPLDPRFHYFDDYVTNANGRYAVDFLERIETQFPTLTELIDIGDAWAGAHDGHARDIWVLRITNEDPAYGPIDEKPVFFLMAGIHAREVATPELAIRYIRYLTEGYDGAGGYGVDADATWLVDHQVAYVIVMQNPDGHAVNESAVESDRRKNVNNSDGCDSPTLWGVDLNRNHSFMWGCCGGSSPEPCDITYRGSARGSEPETQAFETFFASVMEDQNGDNGVDELPSAAPDDTTGIFISLHSYSDMVIWPWAFELAPNSAQLRTIGRKLATFNNYEPSGGIGYAVDGATDDWTYGMFGIPSFTFEVGPDWGSCGVFFPDYECVDGDGVPRDFWAENRPALLYAHKIALTPYLTAYGPDAEALSANPATAIRGTQVVVTATIADHRYNALDPVYHIAAAEYFIDVPGEDGTGTLMAPADGVWGGLSEVVTASIDTSALEEITHYVLVHGQNENGDWGPFTAVFLHTFEPSAWCYLPLIFQGE
jgi:hypothetical protein